MSSANVRRRNQSIRPMSRVICQFRPETDSTWRDAPFIVPESHEETLVPTMGTAKLKYSYGNIARAYRRAFGQELPTDAEGLQVRIQQFAGDDYRERINMFAGVVQIDDHMIGGGAGPNGRRSQIYGDQMMTAYGPEFFLDRAPVIQSLWSNGEASTFLGIAPVFNRRGAGGIIVGNRSAGILSQKSYVLQDGGERWSAFDILQYLFSWENIEGGFVFEMTGQIQPLQNFYPVLDATGKTVWNILSELTNKNRGIAARILWDGESEIVKIEFASNTDIALAGEEFSIPANPNITDLDLSTDRRIQNVQMGEDTLPQVDAIIVRGGMFSTTFTISPQDGAIVAGWSEEQETAYKNAGNNVNGYADQDETTRAILSDQARASKKDEWEKVYQYYKIADGFTFVLPERQRTIPRMNFVANPNGPTNYTAVFPAANLMPQLDGEANILLDTPQPQVSRWRTFNRETAIFRDIDYTAETLPSLEGEEPVTAIIFALGSAVVEEGKTVTRYYDITEGIEGRVPRCSIRPDETQPAIWVRSSPPHSLALVDFLPGDGGNANPTQLAPQVDWRKFFFTLSMPTNRHTEIIRRINDTGRRTKVIEVADAELWWLAPGTLVSVEENGTMIGVTTPEGVIVRDDRPRLRAIATMAEAWYSRPRVPLRFTFKGLTGAPAPGVFIRSVGFAPGVRDSNTMVTRVSYNYKEQSITVRTEYSEIDFSLAFEGSGRSSAAGGGGAMGAAISKLQSQVSQIPARYPDPGFGAGTNSGGNAAIFVDGCRAAHTF